MLAGGCQGNPRPIQKVRKDFFKKDTGGFFIFIFILLYYCELRNSSQAHFLKRLSQADEPRMSKFSAENYATVQKVVPRKSFVIIHDILPKAPRKRKTQMKIQNNHNLSKLNTFGISVNAKFFIELETEADLKELFNTTEFKNNKKIFLGGGSNVLFTKDFDGIVVLNKLKGIEILNEDSENVFVRCMGGVIWHDLVLFAVERDLWGIENLSLIPGTVGAAPMQNIGAYGAELKNVLENVEAYNIENGSKRIFTREECELGYRDSIFKNSLKDKYFISSITLKLSKI